MRLDYLCIGEGWARASGEPRQYSHDVARRGFNAGLFADLAQIRNDIFHGAIEQHAVLERNGTALLKVVSEILARFLHDLEGETIAENEHVRDFDFRG